MKITFKLYASLTEYLPPAARRDNRIALEGAADATIPPEQRATRTFVEGDVLAIWPPIAGG